MADHSFLNNHAIMLLQDEKYEEAASTLSVALKAIAQTMRMLESFTGTHASRHLHAQSQIHAVLDFLPSAAELSGHNEGDIVTTGIDSHKRKVIMQDPIYIHSYDGLSPSSSSVREYQLHAYGIVYNTALCFHLKAAGTEDRQNTKDLRQALSLYLKAQALASGSNLGLPPLYCMSIVSNIGHIHCCLGDPAKAEACFQILSSAIAYLVNTGVDDVIISRLERFLFNATLPGIFQKNRDHSPRCLTPWSLSNWYCQAILLAEPSLPRCR
jgi:hypothetical protein